MKRYKVLCAVTKPDSFWKGKKIPINGKPHSDYELGVPWALIIDKETMTVIPHFTKLRKMQESQSFIDYLKKWEEEE